MKSVLVLLACAILVGISGELWAQGETMWYDVQNDVNGGSATTWSDGGSRSYSSDGGSCGICGKSSSSSSCGICKSCNLCDMCRTKKTSCDTCSEVRSSQRDGGTFQRNGSTVRSYATPAKNCLMEVNGRWALIACPVDYSSDRGRDGGNGGTTWYDTRKHMNRGDGGMNWQRDGGTANFSTRQKTCLIESNGDWAAIDCPADYYSSSSAYRDRDGGMSSSRTMWYDVNRDVRGNGATSWSQDGSYGSPRKQCLIQSGGGWATIDCPSSF